MTEHRRPGGRRDPELEARWRAQVAAWQSSGLTARAFCREHGIGENSFYVWRRELRVRDGLAPQTSPTGRPAGGINPATAGPDAAAAAHRTRPAFVAVNVASRDAADSAPVEIVLDDGSRVHVHEQAEVSTITNVLRALRALREPGGGAAGTNGTARC